MSDRDKGARDPNASDLAVRKLWRQRPRNSFVRATALAMLVLVLAAWLFGGLSLGELFTERRARNLERFLTEIRPRPLQGRDFDWGVAIEWAEELMTKRGWSGAIATLAISVAAIVLAAVGALLLCLPAARNFANPEPFLPETRAPPALHRWVWRSIVTVTRVVLIFLRAIPEYIWAFLLIAMIGPTAWPAVLALAIHNAGIVGKLTSEVVEDVERPALSALRGLGARRGQIALIGIFPVTLPRFLLYFFYRWESCVREATVLGMLGIVSLGFWIIDARVRLHYDQMLFLVLVGAALVLVGDLVSALARGLVRRAS